MLVQQRWMPNQERTNLSHPAILQRSKRREPFCKSIERQKRDFFGHHDQSLRLGASSKVKFVDHFFSRRQSRPTLSRWHKVNRAYHLCPSLSVVCAAIWMPHSCSLDLSCCRYISLHVSPAWTISLRYFPPGTVSSHRLSNLSLSFKSEQRMKICRASIPRECSISPHLDASKKQFSYVSQDESVH